MSGWYKRSSDGLSVETVRRVKAGETWDPKLRELDVFIAERREGYVSKGRIWMRASVFETGVYSTTTWYCGTEDEAVKWFNAYVELYGPPKRGEFLGFHYYGSNISKTNVVPPMSCGS